MLNKFTGFDVDGFDIEVVFVSGVAVPPVPAVTNGSSNGAVTTNGHSEPNPQPQANGHHKAVEQPINNLSTATSQSSKKRKKKRRRKRRTRGEKAVCQIKNKQNSTLNFLCFSQNIYLKSFLNYFWKTLIIILITYFFILGY